MSAYDLRAAGVPPRTERAWVERGLLVRHYAGVYTPGHGRLTLDGRRLAAVLACGPPAGLGYLHGAQLHGCLSGRLGPIDVVIPHGRRIAAIDGVHVVRSRTMRTEDVTLIRATPVFTLPWILLQIAGVLPTQDFERALQAAERERPLTTDSVRAVLERAPRARGAGLLQATFGLAFEERTSAEFVDLYLALCRRHDLPTPETGRYIDAGLPHLSEADLWYPPAKLIVELDGAAVHLSRRSFESDRRRDAAFLAKGIATLRVTWRRLVHDGPALAEELRTIIEERWR